jgi:hypothetical protein
MAPNPVDRTMLSCRMTINLAASDTVSVLGYTSGAAISTDTFFPGQFIVYRLNSNYFTPGPSRSPTRSPSKSPSRSPTQSPSVPVFASFKNTNPTSQPIGTSETLVTSTYWSGSGVLYNVDWNDAAGRYTTSMDGMYLIQANMAFDASSGYHRNLIKVNEASVATSTSGRAGVNTYNHMPVFHLISLSAGDRVQFYVQAATATTFFTFGVKAQFDLIRLNHLTLPPVYGMISGNGVQSLSNADLTATYFNGASVLRSVSHSGGVFTVQISGVYSS